MLLFLVLSSFCFVPRNFFISLDFHSSYDDAIMW